MLNVVVKPLLTLPVTLTTLVATSALLSTVSLSSVVGSFRGERVFVRCRAGQHAVVVGVGEEDLGGVAGDRAAPWESLRTRTWMWIARPVYQPGQIVLKLT
jgi:hypothetical protein